MVDNSASLTIKDSSCGSSKENDTIYMYFNLKSTLKSFKTNQAILF